ncbi:MAG: hypothetical protein WAT79_04765 [Saprospiraceae bacterium]
MVIDFGVKESKSYSFFIENLLLKISIEKKPDHAFDYFLSDENISPTFVYPIDKTKNLWILITIAVLISFIILLIWIFSFSKS